MSAEQSLKEGNLDEAKCRLQEQVRKDPGKPEHRVFLFQLLSVLGEWDRALTQLRVLEELDAAALPMVRTYSEALRCEAFRAEVFGGRRSPLVLGEPESWMAALVEALRLLASGQPDAARELRERAFEGAPAVGGTIDGQPFDWIADADSRLGPALEVILKGRYYWVPLQRIRDVRIEPPTDLRDVVWLPAHFEWTNGGDSVGLIPTRYPSSETSDDPGVRLARRTDWEERAGDTLCGMGQRMLATDRGEFPILDVRRIELATLPPEAAPPALPG